MLILTTLVVAFEISASRELRSGANFAAQTQRFYIAKGALQYAADHPEVVGKTEGMTLLGDGALALINDDDFGISGARTQIAVVRGTEIKRR